ncbi:MAG: DUF5036 family protein [Muribaculaceae bacterium]|nr:DUF5036 family protein [Muribaculaceae bacterium]
MKKIFFLALIMLATVSCGSDEPEATDATMMNENHGKTMLTGTDVYLNADGQLITSGDYSISICSAGSTINSVEIQNVAVSLNKRMAVNEGKVYAVIPSDRIRNFKSGKLGAEAGAPVVYIAVTERLKDGNEITGIKYKMLRKNVELGSLPKWDTNYKCKKVDEDSWNVTLPVAYNSHEVTMYDNLYTCTSKYAEGGKLNLEINHKYVKADHSDDYEDKLLVTYTLDNQIYIRYGSACTRALLTE